MSNLHLQNWFEQERNFIEEEKVWLEKLLSVEFPERDILVSQLKMQKL